MRNMVQLLGGVAVAGAVAAGSTAFTASSITNSSATVYMGGSATTTVTGATLSAVSLTMLAGSGNSDKVVQINAELQNAGVDATTGTLALTVTSHGTSTALAAATCAYDSVTDNRWECVASANALTDYWWGVSSLAFEYRP